MMHRLMPNSLCSGAIAISAIAVVQFGLATMRFLLLSRGVATNVTPFVALSRNTSRVIF